MARQTASRTPASKTPADRMEVRLKAYPNPDHGQYGSMGITASWVRVDGVREASKVAQDFILAHGLGGGNWGPESGQIRKNGTVIGCVSYNGRIWAPDGSEIKP